MARTRLARMSTVWLPDVPTIVGRYYLYPDGVYRAKTATTGVPPTGVSDANYDLIPETQFPNKWSHPEADWANWAMVAGRVDASYAQMTDDTIALASIGAGWTPIQNYAAETFTPRNITTDLVAGTFQFPKPGVYAMSVNLFLTHDESQQGRTTDIRFFNVTDGTVGGQITIGIARNQPATTFSTLIMFLVTDTDANDQIRLEIGNGDTITVATGEVVYGAFQVSEFRDY